MSAGSALEQKIQGYFNKHQGGLPDWLQVFQSADHPSPKYVVGDQDMVRGHNKTSSLVSSTSC